MAYRSDDETGMDELDWLKLPPQHLEAFKGFQKLDKTQYSNGKAGSTSDAFENPNSTDQSNTHNSAPRKVPTIVTIDVNTDKMMAHHQKSRLKATNSTPHSYSPQTSKRSFQQLHSVDNDDSRSPSLDYGISGDLLHRGTITESYRLEKSTETINEDRVPDATGDGFTSTKSSPKSSIDPDDSSPTSNLSNIKITHPSESENNTTPSTTEPINTASNLLSPAANEIVVCPNRVSAQATPYLNHSDSSGDRAEKPPLQLSVSTQNLYEQKRSILICFVHPKAGGSGSHGKKVLSNLKRLLSPAQVFDITDVDLHGVLKYCSANLPRYGWRVLVGGGDGSVAWVLTELDKLGLQEHSRPPVAPLPLGTGNDLSRVLGWGGGYTGENLQTILKQVFHSRVVMLDRWQLCSSNESDVLPLTVINNYFTIGLDAEIANCFNDKRKKNPDRFTSRTGNKLIYAKETVNKIFKQEVCIYRVLQLICDNEDYTHVLAEHKPKTLLILNICSYAGGYDPWGTPNRQSRFTTQRPNDGKLEVCIGDRTDMILNLTASKHVQRICQASDIRLRLSGDQDVSVQVDGEPWRQPAGDRWFHIRYKNSVPMFLGKTKQSKFKSSSSITEPWNLPKHQSLPNANNNNNHLMLGGLGTKTTSAHTWNEVRNKFATPVVSQAKTQSSDDVNTRR